MQKWVYVFNEKKTDGDQSLKNLLGGKGANLAQMSKLNLPVPPGLTITTEACLDYYKQDKNISQEIKDQVINALKDIESITGKTFGGKDNPLLFSVRSGARVSMPGMMDTVLNLGLNDETTQAMARLTGDERFAWDSYRRFIQMFSNVVLGVSGNVFESQLHDLKDARGVKEDTELSAEDLKELVAAYKEILSLEFNKKFPTDPYEQLWMATGAVFNSWHNSRAIKYRQMNGFDDSWGTAVNIQSMVFGNKGNTSATGVCFTRNPSTGEKIFFGEFLVNAQGEDVVAGIRTPQPINEESKNESNQNLATLEKVMPDSYKELVDIYQKLEAHYGDMQDIEFTIEESKLYILQTRNGKRTVKAALKIATDMVNEGIIDKKEALLRVRPHELDQLLHPRLDPKAEKVTLARGLPASPGAASGKLYFTSEDAVEAQARGESVILIRQETSPEDISGMSVAKGILTARGGMTSHAAVVARGMGKPCVAGCVDLFISERDKTVKVNGRTFHEGDLMTFDGASGEVYEGEIQTLPAELSDDFNHFMNWADEVRTLKIRTNADTPQDAKQALEFGAEGIGLCRTEHMFFDPERILAVREMIFADNKFDRNKALAKLLPFQKKDFRELFEVMDGRPVNIRLLDPPLHEFLPHKKEELEEVAKSLELNFEEVRERFESLHEFNPMLGHRGCRLAMTYPEIYQMQVQAMAEAIKEMNLDKTSVSLEIMVPLVSESKELFTIRESIQEVIDRELESFKNHKNLSLKIGTMLELPRACLTADKIAKVADFLSFGTNDLTQTTYGLSRDDSSRFMGSYLGQKIYANDPFVSLDRDGVGELVKIACEKSRSIKSDISVGICGEHGGDPHSIDFCNTQKMSYVSCSPFRVPIARLAAAQAAIK